LGAVLNRLDLTPNVRSLFHFSFAWVHSIYLQVARNGGNARLVARTR